MRKPARVPRLTVPVSAALLSDRLALGLWPAFAVDELFRVAGVPDAVGSLPPPAVMAAVLVTVVPGAKLAATSSGGYDAPGASESERVQGNAVLLDAQLHPVPGVSVVAVADAPSTSVTCTAPVVPTVPSLVTTS